jgi:hypothetical protein
MYLKITWVVRKAKRRHSGATKANVIHPARCPTPRQIKNNNPDATRIDPSRVSKRMCRFRGVHGVIDNYNFAKHKINYKTCLKFLKKKDKIQLHIQICLGKVEHECVESQ